MFTSAEDQELPCLCSERHLHLRCRRFKGNRTICFMAGLNVIRNNDGVRINVNVPNVDDLKLFGSSPADEL